MTIEEEVFGRRQAIPERLLACGFRMSPEDGTLQREYSLMDGQFLARIRITGNRVHGRVYETESGEEYLPFHVRSQRGSFVTALREDYIRILKALSMQGFTAPSFVFAQSNRLSEWIEERYGDRPEYPFASEDTGAVFRNRRNGKWYGLLLSVGRSKIERPVEAEGGRGQADNVRRGSGSGQAAGRKQRKRTQEQGEEGAAEERVEVLNVKLPPERIRELLERPGYFPAYHMSKKSWLTVILDGTLPDETVRALLKESFELVERGKARKKKEIHCWLIPAHPKYYDIVSGFREQAVHSWKQSAAVHAGDMVYIYVGAPVSAILYRCVAEAVDLPAEQEAALLKTVPAKKRSPARQMRLRLLETYPETRMPRKRMQELGVYGVRGPREMPEELLRALWEETGEECR